MALTYRPRRASIWLSLVSVRAARLKPPDMDDVAGRPCAALYTEKGDEFHVASAPSAGLMFWRVLTRSPPPANSPGLSRLYAVSKTRKWS